MPEVDVADGGTSSSLGSPDSGVLVDEYAICEEAQRRWLDDNVPGWEDREPVDVLREIAKAGLVEDVPNCTGL